ncbi:hypothetical protein MKK69_09080 [Methylobacterium sp. J-026]|uniref:hypothetical protein n=1 Tax=Methylobacterium sp. J-026 TaxID=2836624 RepID=UPI001FBBC8E0|nr:hypothetical protein [Methylobacterium sp. J-026]MCJ2134206.1 hypothetical protein [Methylobacterium sp. J-026]
MDKDLVDAVLGAYDRFLIIGVPASVFYITTQLRRLGKPFTHINTLNLELVDERTYECILMTGAWGKPSTDKPVYQLFFAGFSTPHGQFLDSRQLSIRSKADAYYKSLGFSSAEL